MRKLGIFQQQIYNYMLEHPAGKVSEIYDRFSPYKHRAGERNGHFEMWRVTKVLTALQGRGLIRYNQYETSYVITNKNP